MYSIGNNSQYLVISYNGKMEKNLKLNHFTVHLKLT